MMAESLEYVKPSEKKEQDISKTAQANLLYSEGYEAYQNNMIAVAILKFHEAAELAFQAKNTSIQRECLTMEAYCYQSTKDYNRQFERQLLRDILEHEVPPQFIALDRLVWQLFDTQDSLSKQLEEERINASKRIRESVELKKEFSKPDHIRLFMITPFRRKYSPAVINAMRFVFEREPFWFEVAVADNDRKSNNLVESVKRHIATAHGFIAEASEMTSNVLMEVGSALFSSEKRPIFVIKNDQSQKEFPKDFGDLLYLKYRDMSESNLSQDEWSDLIAHDIKEQLLPGGSLKNDELKELVNMRRNHFLSSVLLEESVSTKIARTIRSRYTTIEAFIHADDNALKELKIDGDYLIVKGTQKKLLEQIVNA